MSEVTSQTTETAAAAAYPLSAGEQQREANHAEISQALVARHGPEICDAEADE